MKEFCALWYVAPFDVTYQILYLLLKPALPSKWYEYFCSVRCHSTIRTKVISAAVFALFAAVCGKITFRKNASLLAGRKEAAVAVAAVLSKYMAWPRRAT